MVADFKGDGLLADDAEEGDEEEFPVAPTAPPEATDDIFALASHSVMAGAGKRGFSRCCFL